MSNKTTRRDSGRGGAKRHKSSGGAKKSEDKIPWDKLDRKRDVYLDIMREIVKNPDLGKLYYGSDKKARKAFEDRNMVVPPDVKIVFLRPGDGDKFGAGSAVIELPKPGRNLSDDDLLDLFLCTYTINW